MSIIGIPIRHGTMDVYAQCVITLLTLSLTITGFCLSGRVPWPLILTISFHNLSFYLANRQKAAKMMTCKATIFYLLLLSLAIGYEFSCIESPCSTWTFILLSCLTAFTVFFGIWMLRKDYDVKRQIKLVSASADSRGDSVILDDVARDLYLRKTNRVIVLQWISFISEIALISCQFFWTENFC